MKRIKLLMVEDHAIVREGLKLILEGLPDIHVAGEAGNAAEALKLVRKLSLDLVLLDISLPGQSGLDLLKLIKAEQPDLCVLVLSMYPEDQYALRVLKAGAAGYLTKESAPEQLVGAIRKVAHGGKYISQPVAEKLAGEWASRRSEALHDTLSDREFEILRLIASGMSSSRIATEVRLSVKTISTYRARIIAKTGLRSNAELTHYAIKHGLVV
jgi:two-component system, NarL family, invasion response regulator UvrY